MKLHSDNLLQTLILILLALILQSKLLIFFLFGVLVDCRLLCYLAAAYKSAALTVAGQSKSVII